MVLRLSMALCLGMAFLFSGCADVERDHPYDPDNPNNIRGSIFNGNVNGNVYCQFSSSSSSVPVPSSSSVALSSSSSFVSMPCGNTVTGVGTVACDGKTYNTVEIGDQVWMKENLDYDVPNNTTDVCYNNAPSNCTAYGRLYNWATAMALDPGCNSNNCASQIQTPKHRGICPSGWHIPNDDDWSRLFDYVGGSSVAGKHLKAKTGWQDCGPSGSGRSYSCEDSHGFSALPGGNGRSNGSFSGVGYDGLWWSASENNSSYAYRRYMGYDGGSANMNYHFKTYLFSVRCLQD